MSVFEPGSKHASIVHAFGLGTEQYQYMFACCFRSGQKHANAFCPTFWLQGLSTMRFCMQFEPGTAKSCVFTSASISRRTQTCFYSICAWSNNNLRPRAEKVDCGSANAKRTLVLPLLVLLLHYHYHFDRCFYCSYSYSYCHSDAQYHYSC